MQKFISTVDLSREGLWSLLDLARRGKSARWTQFARSLEGFVIGLLFFNPSLRTRASFQSGIARLGGRCAVLNAGGSETWGIEFSDGAVMNADRSEHVKELCSVLSGYFDAVCVRSFAHMNSWAEDRQDTAISAFASYLKVPLISMESSLWHPCQALADAMTIREHLNEPLGRKFVLTWAPHPKQLPMAVPNSAALIAAQLGMEVRIACPPAYGLDGSTMSLLAAACEQSGASIRVYDSQTEAFRGADVIYAKSWTPPCFVGRLEEEMQLRQELQNWTVSSRLMALTDEALFMHCLPVRRNVVVTDEVIDSRRSVIAEQAENRMHAQNALLLTMLCADSGVVRI